MQCHKLNTHGPEIRSNPVSYQFEVYQAWAKSCLRMTTALNQRPDLILLVPVLFSPHRSIHQLPEDVIHLFCFRGLRVTEEAGGVI